MRIFKMNIRKKILQLTLCLLGFTAQQSVCAEESDFGTNMIDPPPLHVVREADIDAIRHTEISNFRAGLSQHAVEKLTFEKPKISKVLRSADYGTYYQIWKFKKLGVEITFTRATPQNSDKTISRILVYPLSTVATDKGIHIGSTKEDVLKAYPLPSKYWSKGDYIIEDSNKIVVVNLLTFTIATNKVVKIELNDKAP